MPGTPSHDSHSELRSTMYLQQEKRARGSFRTGMPIGMHFVPFHARPGSVSRFTPMPEVGASVYVMRDLLDAKDTSSLCFGRGDV